MGAAVLEEAFSAISDALIHPASPRWKLHALREFLRLLDTAGSDGEAYLLELADQIYTFAVQLDSGGLPPQVPEETAQLLGHLIGRSAVLRDEPLLAGTQALLMTAAASRAACIGDMEGTWRALSGAAPIPDWWVTAGGGAVIDPIERIGQMTAVAAERLAAVTSRLETIESVAKSAFRDGPHAACAAVVETGFGNGNVVGNGGVTVGGVRLLRVEILGRRQGRDDVRPDVLLTPSGEDGSAAVQAAVSAGRALLQRLSPSTKGTFLAGRILFENPSIGHEGSSAGLAIAALYFSAAQDFLEVRHRYEIARLVTLTGSVDSAGNVLPVADESLAAKAEAAFHSWSRVLVVPFSQFFAARATVDRLEEAFPNRRLVVVGVKTLDDLLSDRRVMKEINVPPTRYAAQWAWRRRVGVGGISLMVLLAAALLSVLIGPLDRNAIEAKPSADGMVFLNGDGRKVGEVRTPTRSVYPVGEGARLVTLGDIDGDGVNDVCWLERSETPELEEHGARCRQVSGGDLVFTVNFRFPGVFPDDPQIASDRYLPRSIHLTDIEGDGRSELVIAVNHSSLYPALLLVYDPRSGLELGRYVHTGGFVDLLPWDITGDGLPEILGIAMNNALHDGVLFVLDPRRLSGSSYTNEGRMPADYSPGHELAYVRMPQGPIGKMVDIVPGTRAPRTVVVEPPDRHILVSVLEGLAPADTSLGVVQATMIYYLDYQLRPVAVATGSEYDRLESRLHQRGMIDHPMTNDEKAALMSEFRYWDGEVWHDSVWTRLPKPQGSVVRTN